MTAKPKLAPAAVTSGRVGDSVRRPDAALKTRGDFPYSSDLRVDRMLWGATVRSPHAYARIVSIDTSEAHSMPGVHAVLSHEDVPGRKVYGLEIPDQPVLAVDVVRYWGEAVALVAADHPEQARRAAQAVRVEYEVLAPLTDPELALTEGAPRLHPDGNLTRGIKIRRGDQSPHADVVVTGEYEVGMQDQAPLGPESGLAIPDGAGGVDLYIATQWLHIDREQLASVLALPDDAVRLTMAGIGGAFGAREDLSMQAHACMLALKTGRPVKMSYSRAESFVGHVHRHPARLRYEHGATRDGKRVCVHASSRAGRSPRPHADAGWCVQHHTRGGSAPRRRLRGGFQERRLLGRLQRLFDRASSACGGWRAAARGGAHRGRGGRPGPRDGAGPDRRDGARRARHRRDGRRHAGRLVRLIIRVAA